MIKISLLFVAMLLFTAVNAQTLEVTTADGNGADTYLSNDTQAPRFSADSSHGDEASMKFRNLEGVRQKFAYFRFDVSSVKTPETQIESAMIGLWPTAYKGVPLNKLFIYAMTNEALDDWDEMTTCYNTAPGFIPTTSGVPVGYYDFTEDMVLVDTVTMDADVVAPGSDWRVGIDFFYSLGSAAMDEFINNDTNGLLTFAVIGNADQDQDGDFASKEDPEPRAPKLIFTTATAINNENVAIISEYKLNQNYPNPFNPVTNIEFTLTKPGHTALEIYNTLGQPVATLIDGQMSSGHHQITFKADGYTSGIYFYKLTSGNFTEVKKMMLLK